MTENVLTKQRLDTWLWAARFFKTRRLATEAISGGKIHLNGQRSKPSKEVRIDDSLQIHKAGYQWTVKIVGLNPQRRPAKEAVLLYKESDESLQQRHALKALNKDMNASMPRSERPNKKQRRQIHRFKQTD
ncbi:MAG: ribosome-associated heat shock protein Hsp15 [Cycloclasticus pugetii]|uniref:Heat shock protein 15 n=1 Tax=Cycloclasticus zancles 78-ME TaxID=1198232 RepID=S5TZ96_9GAMM|nr:MULTISPECIES: S4 domain-containing protein [Cycloclasticus]AGS40550.1 Ribosome-associated heat shock protein Hsp15 [Cycloclasticus zancles 78-ME]MDF1829656.1 S4 domain-containing protein [Cycloclasticus pugetii]